jgi:hypothetical protein
MYFELDGTFPNHEANPLEPANLVDLQKAVVAHKADLGLAFDGDADRCFVIDENGDPVNPSAVAAMVTRREIARVKALGEDSITVLYNLITSKVVAEVIEADGAKAERTKVGHSLIKDRMAETNAIFGGEHSAHYYFRDFWGADNGMLAAMHVLAEFGSRHDLGSRLGRTRGSHRPSFKSVAPPKPVCVLAFLSIVRFDVARLFPGATGQPHARGRASVYALRPGRTAPRARREITAPSTRPLHGALVTVPRHV